MKVIGFDGYNQSLTGGVSKSMTNKATDSDHLPCVVIEGNGSRPSHRGDGVKISDTMYCLNQVDRHAVCYNQEDLIILNHHIPRDTYIPKDQKNIQSLISRAGTGGGNVPIIMTKENKK